MWGFLKLGYLFGDPHNEDHSMLGSILGSPYFGKLSCMGFGFCVTVLLFGALAGEMLVAPGV